MKIFPAQFIKDLLFSVLFISLIYAAAHNPITHPMPKPSKGDWSIQLIQSPILFGIAGHNYLVLSDGSGREIDELHGLATDHATGKWKYIGRSPTDTLKVWEFVGSGHYLSEKNFSGIILREGQKSEIEEIWNKGISCKDPINSRNLPYPPFGININGNTENSNSVAYTLALCMGLDTRHLGIFTPGETMNLLTK